MQEEFCCEKMKYWDFETKTIGKFTPIDGKYYIAGALNAAQGNKDIFDREGHIIWEQTLDFISFCPFCGTKLSDLTPLAEKEERI